MCSVFPLCRSLGSKARLGFCLVLALGCETRALRASRSLSFSRAVRRLSGGGGGGSLLPTEPIEGMRPGTSGLRKRTSVWRETPRYVENFAQSLVEAWRDAGLDVEKEGGATLVVGGDGRFFNEEALRIVSRVAAANGVRRVVVPRGGVISTPAASALVRRLGADGAVLLTASHNPGGPSGDFGIKFNTGPDGAPAKEGLTEAVWEVSKTLRAYRDLDSSELAADTFDLEVVGERALGSGSVLSVVDANDAYVAQLKECFDFARLSSFVAERKPALLFDAMHGAAGPACVRVLCEELGVAQSSLLRCDPRPDFGGAHPDPNLVWAAALVRRVGLSSDGSALSREETASEKLPDLGAAFDGDGDRNMVVGSRFFVTPSDSLAVLAARGSSCIKWFKDRGGIKAVARSMPTSRALDRVAAKLKFRCFETPTGWKYFGNLMEVNEFTPFLCGEESFGTGADHVREKDGLWAALAWLSVLADANADATAPFVSVAEIVRAHWTEFGRDLYCRHDFEEVESQGAEAMMDALRALAATGEPPAICDEQLRAQLAQLGGLSAITEFDYVDPVDGSKATRQGIVLSFGESAASRVVFRLSGTGSAGATVRMYVERYVADPTQDDLDAVAALTLQPLAAAAARVARLNEFTGRSEASVIT